MKKYLKSGFNTTQDIKLEAGTYSLVAYVKSSTFRGCTNLVEAPIIPEGVTNMIYTFSGCSKLNGIYIIKPLTPPTDSSSLINVVSIYITDESVDLYKAASGWSGFSSKIYPLSTKP